MRVIFSIRLPLFCRPYFSSLCPICFSSGSTVRSKTVPPMKLETGSAMNTMFAGKRTNAADRIAIAIKLW